MHGRASGGPSRDLHDRGAQVDARGVRTDPRQRRKTIHTIYLRAPDGVIAQIFCFFGEGDDFMTRRLYYSLYAQPLIKSIINSYLHIL